MPHKGDLFLRVVNQGGQGRPVGIDQGAAKKVVNFFPYHAGGAAEQMKKSLMLPVNIAEKIFSSLWEAHDGF